MKDPEAPADQASLFARMAAGYDAAIRVYQPTYDELIRLSTDLACIGAAQGRACLDYGTGTGAALPLLAARFDRVVGVDPNPAMLDIARSRVASADGAGRVELIQGVARAPAVAELADASFDAVHCALVLMFVPDAEGKLATLRALRRLLRPGGVLVQVEIVQERGEEPVFEAWRAVMRHRGAEEEQVATAERQIHGLMHRTSAADLRALHREAGFTTTTEVYRSFHTAVFTAR